MTEDIDGQTVLSNASTLPGRAAAQDSLTPRADADSAADSAAVPVGPEPAARPDDDAPTARSPR